MYDENEEDQITDDRHICPKCGLRQYDSVCANCHIQIYEEEDPEKKKEDEYDEYDWREKR